MTLRILVQPLCRTPVERCGVELVEHKGVGHPDTIVDGACEAVSRALSRAYLAHHGCILHHNVDKGLLAAGRSRLRFRGGEVLEPFRLILGGRATSTPQIDVRQLALGAARAYLQERLHCAPAQFELMAEIREGAASLQEVFTRSPGLPLANDTSFGCGYAPYSRLERAVLALAQVLGGPELHRHFPAAGYDFKIMGWRAQEDFGFTVALAFIDRHIEDTAHYFAVKRATAEHLAAHLPVPGTLHLNTLDDPQARDENGLYLTVTGLSAEMGDDGQAGRGNRVNGLITPGRPMSLEAAAGKNPVAHVGKLYNALARQLARDIHAQVTGVEEVSVQLLARIGRSLDEPEIAEVEVAIAGGLTGDVRARIAERVEAGLGDLARLTREILDEKVSLF